MNIIIDQLMQTIQWAESEADRLRKDLLETKHIGDGLQERLVYTEAKISQARSALLVLSDKRDSS